MTRSDVLRALAVDEPAVPPGLAERATRAAFAAADVPTAAQLAAPPAFLDALILGARRALLVGAATAAVLAAVAALHGTSPTPENPLVAWWSSNLADVGSRR
jgi:hypothetical protein